MQNPSSPKLHSISLEQQIFRQATNSLEVLEENQDNQIFITSKLSQIGNQIPNNLFDNIIKQNINEAINSPVGWIRMRAAKLAISK